MRRLLANEHVQPGAPDEIRWDRKRDKNSCPPSPGCRYYYRGCGT